MGSHSDIRSQEIARLQLELASASRRLDELEKRSRLRACQAMDPVEDAASLAETSELRFAACVASGMTKLQLG